LRRPRDQWLSAGRILIRDLEKSHRCGGFALPGPVLWAQDADKPAIAPAYRTINLTLEQRFIIRENVKDLNLPKAQANATETIGDQVPDNIELHPMPPEVANKVLQARSHSFFVKDADNAIVLVSPSDRDIMGS
jgi:hypothetical protein